MIFRRKKKPDPTPPPETVTTDIAQLQSQRAPRNPHQELLPAGVQHVRATDLIANCGDSAPALREAMFLIAKRFEDSVNATHQLNVALRDFKDNAVNQIKSELNLFRYNMGDKVNHTTTNLEVMVDKLDKILWGVLRAQGMTDAQIRSFREQNGMSPEAPKGFEIEAHIDRVNALQSQVEVLTRQNQRLLARLSDHRFSQGQTDWVWRQDCTCSLCRAEDERQVAAQQEVSRVSS